MMTKNQFIDEIDRRREALHTAAAMAIVLEALYPGRNDFQLTMGERLLIRVFNYPEVVTILRDLAQKGLHLKFSNQWSSYDDVLFSWRADGIELWLVCKPEEIPQDLKGPGCILVKKTVQNVEYHLECPL
jgi:hypothetical protein